MSGALIDLVARSRSDGRIARGALAALAAAARDFTDDNGRATPALERALLAIEGAHGPELTEGAAAAFQTLVARVGARMRAPMALPEDDTPYWLLGPHPLAGHRSAKHPPRRADVVVVGAGLTGASAAWHLAHGARRGLTTVVLDAGDPGMQASGRNGGNFELMPENFRGEYQGLPEERRKFLARCYPGTDEATLRARADRQARLIMRVCAANTRRFLDLVARERIACDLSPGGWLRIADTPGEEQGIRDEVRLAATLGIRYALWSPAETRKRLAIPCQFLGRMARRSGNYHPFKFVCALLERALARGVQLYTRTPVIRLRAGSGERITVETPAGRIDAGRVIVATNAFTRDVLPELGAIAYYQSQILNLEHVRDTLRGMTVTEKKGDLYYNFPAAGRYRDPRGLPRGMLHVGGGLDRPGSDPTHLVRSPSVFRLVRAQTDERFPETRGQPPSRLWSGPMAFTPDRVPAIGFLRRPRTGARAIIVAAGFNGYGGSYCVEAGHLAATMALTGETPPEVPEDTFSPHRFLTRELLPIRP